MDTVRLSWKGNLPFPDVLQNELWKHQLHDPDYTSVHGRFMKPLCRALPGCKFPVLIWLTRLCAENSLTIPPLGREKSGSLVAYVSRAPSVTLLEATNMDQTRCHIYTGNSRTND